MDAPRISVVIPSYNHALYVEQAVRSVLGQDYPDVELVVVDDGSTDDSPQLIEALLAREAPAGRARLERQENAGAHAALRRGIELSSGAVIAILNSDDCYHPGRLSQLARHLPVDGGDSLLFSGLELVDLRGRAVLEDEELGRWYELALQQSAQCPSVGFALLCNNIAVTSGNLVFSRALYERVGGFRPLRYCHDWDFILRCLYHVEPVFVAQPLMAYRLHPDNTIKRSTKDDVDEEYSAILTDHLRRCEDRAPDNLLAPCRANFPLYFPYFVQTHTRYDSKLIAELALEPELVAATGPSGAVWDDWGGGVVRLSSRDELGRVVSATRGNGIGPGGELERLLLLRELALVRSGVHEAQRDFAAPVRADRKALALLRELQGRRPPR